MISTRFNPIGKNFGGASVAGTSFEVTTTSDNTTFSFRTGTTRTLATDSSSYSIDWGDGTTDTYTDVTTTPSHSYATPGKYIVTISDDLSECVGSSRRKFISTSTLVTRAISWGSKLEKVTYFYKDCSNLTGSIPKWNDIMTDVSGCYQYCSKLTGLIPEWNDVMTNVSNCYQNCSNLTGPIPEWNDSITNASYCYNNCRSLTGPIPKWNDVMTNVSYCYSDCSNLTGIWDENATDEEIMPSHITSYDYCVSWTPSALRDYFYKSWGGTKVEYVATSFEVTTTSDNTTFSFGTDSCQRTLATDSSSYSIDWGDGTTDTYTDVSTTLNHIYTNAGKYIVTISDDLSECCGSYDTMFETYDLVTRAISWGSKLENVKYFYKDCSNLTGSIPKWNNIITNAYACYQNCPNLTGPIPEWNNTITNANWCYNSCSNLTGPIPEWNNTITTAYNCYSNCSNLTGSIPKWNNVMTDVSNCYSGCSNLTGIWDENATDEEIMPSHITNKSYCVYYTSATLRAYFYPTWGGTKAA